MSIYQYTNNRMGIYSIIFIMAPARQDHNAVILYGIFQAILFVDPLAHALLPSQDLTLAEPLHGTISLQLLEQLIDPFECPFIL